MKPTIRSERTGPAAWVWHARTADRHGVFPTWEQAWAFLYLVHLRWA